MRQYWGLQWLQYVHGLSGNEDTLEDQSSAER